MRFRLLLGPTLAVSALAWAALALWGGDRDDRRGLLTGGPVLMSSDHGGHAGHGGGGGGGGGEMLGLPLHAWEPLSLRYAGGFVGMWAGMVAAMMLPAMLPSVRSYLRHDGRATVPAGARFLGACLAPWLAAGAVLYAGLAALHALEPDPTPTALRVAAAIALGAGLFQFSRAKARVLAHARGPFCRDGGTWRAGVHHGGWCLGSCGPYMLVLVALGMMSLFWMALFALVMVAEQAAEARCGSGARVARGAGAALVVVATAILLSPSTLPLVG